MEKYKLSVPIYVDGVWKILVNHNMVKKIDNLFAGIEYFPIPERDDIIALINDRISKEPKSWKKGYVRKNKIL